MSRQRHQGEGWVHATGSVKKTKVSIWLSQLRGGNGYFFFIMYSCMARAAFLPSPMARMTVAPPRTISPPA